MRVPAPEHCRVEAYELFASSMVRLESAHGLLMAAVAVAMHELHDVDPIAVDRTLQDLADSVRARVRGSSRTALLAHAHQVLFEEHGWRGKPLHQSLPHDAYVPVVLSRRGGTNTVLALLYKVVLERLGLEVGVVRGPGSQLLARVWAGERKPVRVDVGAAGALRTRAEAGRIRPLTHREWIERLLRDLFAVFHYQGRLEDARAMRELARLLDPSWWVNLA